ncbi:MAG: hypothetical protein ABIR18_01695 [Chitinophagaceae bacterium]
MCERVSAQIKAPITEPNNNKPKLFANQPASIAVDIHELEALFAETTEANKDIAVQSADKKSFSFSGKVVSSTSKYNDKIRTLIIRSSNFSGATLTLSSSIQPDGTVEYTGRIISFQHGDLYELENKKDQYAFIKKNFHDLVNE